MMVRYSIQSVYCMRYARSSQIVCSMDLSGMKISNGDEWSMKRSNVHFMSKHRHSKVL